jgi:integrase
MKGKILEHRPGVWHLRLELHRAGDGKRRQTMRTFRGSKREAQNEWRRLQALADAGQLLPLKGAAVRARAEAEAEAARLAEEAAQPKPTVAAYLAEFLNEKRTSGLSPKTLETWADFCRAYINPRIGSIVLTELKSRDVKALYTQLALNGRTRGEGGLSDTTILHVHRLLSEALRAAMMGDEPLIPRNPCDGQAPRHGGREERHGVKAYDRATLRRLYTAVDDHWLYLPVLLSTGLGLRRGEVLGLRWSDIDLTRGTLSVRQTVQEIRGHGLIFKAPKTKKSVRTVTLPAFVLEALQEHSAAQMVHRAEVKEAWQDSGLVIADQTGAPRRPGAVTHAFAKMIKRHELPEITYHDLRHVNATLLLLAGVDTKVVSARLGHCNTTITRDLYQHVVDAQDAAAAQATDAFFREGARV